MRIAIVALSTVIVALIGFVIYAQFAEPIPEESEPVAVAAPAPRPDAISRPNPVNSNTISDEELEQLISTLNANLPITVESGVRLDRTESAPGPKLVYIYTITAPGASKAAFDALPMNRIKRAAAGNAQMRPLFEAGLDVVYKYFNRNGDFLGRIDITPQDAGIR